MSNHVKVAYKVIDNTFNVIFQLQLNGNVPNNLQYINLVIEKQSECKKAHWRVQSSHICTFTKSGEGACHVSIIITFYVHILFYKI